MPLSVIGNIPVSETVRFFVQVEERQPKIWALSLMGKHLHDTQETRWFDPTRAYQNIERIYMIDMKTRCHRKLLLPVKFTPIDFNMGPKNFLESSFTEDQMNDDIRDWLKSLNLQFRYGRYFHAKTSIKYAIHTDGVDTPSDLTFFNFVFGGLDSYLEWFELLPGKSAIPYINQVAAKTNGFNEADCVEIYRASCSEAELGFASLVNGGIPHTVVNGPAFRRCYSLVLGRDNKRLNWDELDTILSPFIVE